MAEIQGELQTAREDFSERNLLGDELHAHTGDQTCEDHPFAFGNGGFQSRSGGDLKSRPATPV